MKVLLVENDTSLSKKIEESLSNEGFKVECFIDEQTAIRKMKETSFDLMIVRNDILKNEGADFFHCLRGKSQYSPVLVIGEAKNMSERIKSLKNGGDDYLTKPFEAVELLSKVETLLKNKQTQIRSEKLSFIDIHLNIVTREVKRANHKIDLHQMEFSLLHFLIEQQGKIVTKNQILERVWGYNISPKTNVVDVLVCRLRNKMDKDHEVKTIHTIRGLGYILKTY